MIIKITSHKKAAFVLWFDNGNSLSIIWGDMTYSDNYDLWKTKPEGYHRNDNMDILESTTVEIMPGGKPAFVKWALNKYDGADVLAYVPVSELPTIIKRADSKVYAKKGTNETKQ